MFPTGFLIFLVLWTQDVLLSDKNSRQQTTQDTSDSVTHVQRTPVSSSMAPQQKEKESFIQKVFYEISLEKDPALWQDDTDTVDKNVERIR